MNTVFQEIKISMQSEKFETLHENFIEGSTNKQDKTVIFYQKQIKFDKQLLLYNKQYEINEK